MKLNYDPKKITPEMDAKSAKLVAKVKDAIQAGLVEHAAEEVKEAAAKKGKPRFKPEESLVEVIDDDDKHMT